MSDEIIGLSVLQPVWIDGIYRLWFTARKGSGEKSQGNIFMRDRRRTGLPVRMPDWPETSNTIWTFIDRPMLVEGKPYIGEGHLDCQPSVNWLSWNFHNAFGWSTTFVEMRIAALHPEVEARLAGGGVAGGTHGNHGPEAPCYHGSKVHYELNLLEGNEADQRALVLELRGKGILR